MNFNKSTCKVLFVLGLLVLVNPELFSQNIVNEKYFNDLRKKLNLDPEIKKTKFIQKKDWKGRIKLQAMFVKLKNDSTNRYWRVGKRFEFTKGRLSWVDNVDIETKANIDTAKYFDCSGNAVNAYIYNNNSSKIYPQKEFYGLGWRFKKYYSYKPESFKGFKYEKGLLVEMNIKYIENVGFMLHGDMIFYDKDGEIEKIVKYSEGSEIK